MVHLDENFPVASTSSEHPLSSCCEKRKRKRIDGDPSGRGSTLHKRNKEANALNDETLDLDSNLNLAIGKLDRQLLADFVAQRTKRFSPNLSPLELEDLYIPGNRRADEYQDDAIWDEIIVLMIFRKCFL